MAVDCRHVRGNVSGWSSSLDKQTELYREVDRKQLAWPGSGDEAAQ